MSLGNQQSMCHRYYGVGENNLFFSIPWYCVAARCVRLTTSLWEASSKCVLNICYLKVFSDFYVYTQEFWLDRQNNADIRVFHPSDLVVHFGKLCRELTGYEEYCLYLQ